MEILIMDPLMKASLIVAAGATVLYVAGFGLGLYLHKAEARDRRLKHMNGDHRA